jgi:hypothetical protein
LFLHCLCLTSILFLRPFFEVRHLRVLNIR